MISVREQILQAVFNKLASEVSMPVLRNSILPEKLTNKGVLIIRDGFAGEPDKSLNPITYYYNHKIEIEVYFEETKDFNLKLDEAYLSIKQAVKDFNHNNLIEYIELGTPDLVLFPVEGARPIVGANIILHVEYIEE